MKIIWIHIMDNWGRKGSIITWFERIVIIEILTKSSVRNGSI